MNMEILQKSARAMLYGGLGRKLIAANIASVDEQAEAFLSQVDAKYPDVPDNSRDAMTAMVFAVQQAVARKIFTMATRHGDETYRRVVAAVQAEANAFVDSEMNELYDIGKKAERKKT